MLCQVFSIQRLYPSASSSVLTQGSQQVEPNGVQGMQVDDRLRQAMLVAFRKEVPTKHAPRPDGTADIAGLQESLTHKLFGITNERDRGHGRLLIRQIARLRQHDNPAEGSFDLQGGCQFE